MNTNAISNVLAGYATDQNLFPGQYIAEGGNWPERTTAAAHGVSLLSFACRAGGVCRTLAPITACCGAQVVLATAGLRPFHNLPLALLPCSVSVVCEGASSNVLAL